MPTEATPTQVNQFIKQLNSFILQSGFKGMPNAFKFTPVQKSTGDFKTAMTKVGINVPISQRDVYMWTTDWNIWEGCLDVVREIAKSVPWTAERFDCDDRAAFVQTLCAIFLKINSCGLGYGKVFRMDGTEVGLHYFNLITTTDGKLYLFDVDLGNRGLITGVDPIVGKNKYKIISAEIY